MASLLQLHATTTRFDAVLGDWAGSLLLLAIRVYVGWQFFKAGLTKIQDWESTLFLFQEEYAVPVLPPALAAVAGTVGELLLPLLLFAGLFSRPAALGLFFVNVIAVFSYPALFEFACPAGLRDHFYWGVLLLAIMAFGPGRFSLDAALNRRHPG